MCPFPFASLKIGGRSAGLKGSPTMIIYLLTRRFRKFHLRARLLSVHPHPCRHSRLNFFGTDTSSLTSYTRSYAFIGCIYAVNRDRTRNI